MKQLGSCVWKALALLAAALVGMIVMHFVSCSVVWLGSPMITDREFESIVIGMEVDDVVDCLGQPWRRTSYGKDLELLVYEAWSTWMALSAHTTYQINAEGGVVTSKTIDGP
ncbi:MAG: hypothetical protein KAS72_06520 [Phycisphaerales bacterium]|nr:hypothetical protein [Phycisphaerales bacterium]